MMFCFNFFKHNSHIKLKSETKKIETEANFSPINLKTIMTIRKLLSSPEFSQKIVLQRLLCDALGITREQMRLMSEKDIEEKDFMTIKR